MSEKSEAPEYVPPIIKAEELDPKFKYKISKIRGAEKIMACLQCGTCTADCPVASFSEFYRPHYIARMIQLGLKDRLLSDKALWLCSSCYNCQERCPQKVEVAEVIYALRNIAIREGIIPAIYAEFAMGLMGEGRLVPISKFVEKKRAEFGLPPLKSANTEALKKILAATDFDKIMFKKESAAQ